MNQTTTARGAPLDTGLGLATAPAPPRELVPILDVEIVIPVYNEEHSLRPCVDRLLKYLNNFPLTTMVTIVDNASTDETWQVAQDLAFEYVKVSAVKLDQKGRGRALRSAWMSSTATVVAYMDVDLSTDLDALLPLVAPLVTGHSDISIGTRLARGSRVVRGPKREFISRSYNMLLRGALGVRFSDAQCGFKAIRSDRARELLPLVEDQEWFFDTEMLAIAERAGLRIHEVPVDWVDDPDSRVDVTATAMADLKGMARLFRGFSTGRIKLEHFGGRPTEVVADPGLWRSVVRFAIVGVFSTIVFGLLFWFFRGFLDAQTANVSALLLATVANTAANRRFTFGVRGRPGAAKHQFQGLLVLAIALGITAGSLAILQIAVPYASATLERAVLTAANLVATVVRFLLFRSWIFRSRTSDRKDGICS
jgi:glycosyltransferase involved in cell wall biosynthesis